MTETSDHDAPATDLSFLDKVKPDLDEYEESRKHLFFLPFCIPVGLLALLALRFNLVAATGVLLAAASTLQPRPIALKWRLTFLGMTITMASAMAPVIVMQGQIATDELARRVEAKGPDTLDVSECFGVYLLSGMMGLGGYLSGYQEVADEHLGMMTRGPSQRRFKSDFPAKSTRVRAAIKAMTEGKLTPAALAAGKSINLGRTQVVFDYAKDPLRWALALNALNLSAVATPEGGKWKIEVEGRVAIRYPKKARTPLGKWFGKTVFIEEGIFWAIQERGWMHPYTAIWTWTE